MGAISMERLLPKHLFRPDDSSPIAALGFPSRCALMRIGFDLRAGEPIRFEGETPVRVRFCQRTWRYKLRARENEPESRTAEARKIYQTNRWRLEIIVDSRQAEPLRPRHMAVVAQTPYGNGWVQAVPLKMYSKKKLTPEEAASKIPVFASVKDVEEQLESAYACDLWETGPSYVAGVSFPKGYRGILDSHPRNTAIDFVFGACPDFEAARNQLLASREIQQLLQKTEQEKIAFWMRGKVPARPRLYQDTKDAAVALMILSIEQALAGPAKSSKSWIGEPVWKLVEQRYCSHLNDCNRKNARRREDQFNGEIERRL